MASEPPRPRNRTAPSIGVGSDILEDILHKESVIEIAWAILTGGDIERLGFQDDHHVVHQDEVCRWEARYIGSPVGARRRDQIRLDCRGLYQSHIEISSAEALAKVAFFLKPYLPPPLRANLPKLKAYVNGNLSQYLPQPKKKTPLRHKIPPKPRIPPRPRGS